MTGGGGGSGDYCQPTFILQLVERLTAGQIGQITTVIRIVSF